MVQNHKYSINELLNNDNFIAWVTSDYKSNDHYWAKVKRDLIGVDKINFDKSEKIIQKIKSLNIDNVDIKSPEFIQQQYIKLLEANSNIQKPQAKVINVNTVLKYAAAIILLISLSGIIYFNTSSKNTFQQHLVASNLNNAEILLQVSDSEYFKISEETNNKWLTKSGIFITIDANNISFVASDDVDQDLDNEFKLIVPKGERYHVTMVDGTEVELNANSTLSFNNKIHAKNREVELNGEAFFDVAHNENRPFIVNSSGSQIEVLGTEFNVSSYKENKFLRTTLIDGSIKILNKIGESLTLRPGEQATIYQDQNEINVQQADVQQAVAWMAGRLIFNNEKFENLIPRLSQWYGVNFVLVGNEINDIKFTGTLKKENDLIYFLQMLQYTEGISYEIGNEQVKLFLNKKQ